MRIIFLILLVISSTQALANMTQSNLSCSFKGTDIVYVNGISWGFDHVQWIANKIISPETDSRQIDSSIKEINSNITPHPKISVSYNHARGFIRDIIESAAQKIQLSNITSEEDAFTLAYYAFYSTPLNPQFIDSILNIKSMSFSEALILITSSFSISEYKEKMELEQSYLTRDTNLLKEHISRSLLADKKLIIISESQGNLFTNRAIEEISNNSLNVDGKEGSINNYLHVLANTQIAPPHFSNIGKSKVVLNNEDIIRLVFFDRPDPTFNNFYHPQIDNRVWLDKFLNHFVDGTYLNVYQSSSPLPELKALTLQSIIDTASLLESNCPVAVFNFTHLSEEQQVKFDATDPERPDLTDITYNWDFGDGTIESTNLKLLHHHYENPGTYNVVLTLTRPDGRAYWEQGTIEKQISIGTSSSITGCNYQELGKYHINPDGTIGGFVANTAYVATTAYIDPNISICGSSQVLGNSVITVDFYWMFSIPIINDSFIINSNLRSESLLNILNSRISNFNIQEKIWYLSIGESDISDSTLNIPSNESFTAGFSVIRNSSFSGIQFYIESSTVEKMNFDVSSFLNIRSNTIYYEGMSGPYSAWPFSLQDPP